MRPPRHLAVLTAIALASCSTVPVRAPAPQACAIAGSSGWAAWINAMPGPDARPKLIVTGKVDAPTGGYRFEWADLMTLESYPVQIVAHLRAVPPSGGATQAVVTQDVRGEWPVSPPVGSLTVRCGEMTLARIAPVETAH